MLLLLGCREWPKRGLAVNEGFDSPAEALAVDGPSS